MIIQIYSINFALIVYTLTILEIKKLNTILTPFTVAAWPLVIIILLTDFVLIYFDFKPITERVHIFLIINLLLLWLIGYIMSFFSKNSIEANTTDSSDLFRNVAQYQLIVIGISWIAIIFNFYRAYSLVQAKGGLWFLGDQEFENIMIQGPIAHLVQVAKVCFLYLIFTWKHARNKRIYFLTVLGLFLAIALIQVKYHLFWILIMSFLFYNINKPVKRQLKSAVILMLGLFLTMNMFWIFLTLVWGTFSLGNEGVWEFVFTHFINYLVSAPIVLDTWLDFEFSSPDWALFTVFLNIKNFIIGNANLIDPTKLVSHGFIDTGPGLKSNVGTAFGVYYLIGGYYFSLFMTALFSFTAYYTFYKSLIIKNEFLVFLNLLLLTLSALSFFVQYFTLLSLYELIGIYFVMILIFKSLSLLKKFWYAS